MRIGLVLLKHECRDALAPALLRDRFNLGGDFGGPRWTGMRSFYVSALGSPAFGEDAVEGEDENEEESYGEDDGEYYDGDGGVGAGGYDCGFLVVGVVGVCVVLPWEEDVGGDFGDCWYPWEAHCVCR